MAEDEKTPESGTPTAEQQAITAINEANNTSPATTEEEPPENNKTTDDPKDTSTPESAPETDTDTGELTDNQRLLAKFIGKSDNDTAQWIKDNPELADNLEKQRIEADRLNGLTGHQKQLLEQKGVAADTQDDAEQPKDDFVLSEIENPFDEDGLYGEGGINSLEQLRQNQNALIRAFNVKDEALTEATNYIEQTKQNSLTKANDNFVLGLKGFKDKYGDKSFSVMAKDSVAYLNRKELFDKADKNQVADPSMGREQALHEAHVVINQATLGRMEKKKISQSLKRGGGGDTPPASGGSVVMDLKDMTPAQREEAAIKSLHKAGH